MVKLDMAALVISYPACWWRSSESTLDRLKSSVEVVAVLQCVLDVRQRLQHVRMFWPRNKQNTGVISLTRRLFCFETCLKFYMDIDRSYSGFSSAGTVKRNLPESLHYPLHFWYERLAELLTESNKLVSSLCDIREAQRKTETVEGKINFHFTSKLKVDNVQSLKLRNRR